MGKIQARCLLLLALAFGGLLGMELPALAQSWLETSAPSSNWVSIASSADGTKLVVVGGSYMDGAIYVSTNSGKSWTPANAPGTSWTGVACSADGTRQVAVVANYPSWSPQAGSIYLSQDSGATWSLTSAPKNYWHAIASSADGNSLVAVAGTPSGSPICYSTNGGTSWLIADAPYSDWRSVASSADGKFLVASASPGLIYISTNSGALWTLTSAPTYNGIDSYLWQVATSADGTRLAVAGGQNGPGFGFVYTSTNSGATWRDTQAPSQDWRALTSSADGTRLWAAMWRGPVFFSADSGATWTPCDVPNKQWSSLISSADGNRLAAAAWFGSVYTWPSAPVLTLKTLGTNAVISWPTLSAAAGFILQGSGDLTTPTWRDITIPPLVTNSENQVVLPVGPGSRFFRLISR